MSATIEHATTSATVDLPVQQGQMPTAVPPDGDGWRPNGGGCTRTARETQIDLPKEARAWVGSLESYKPIPCLLFVWFWWREVPA